MREQSDCIQNFEEIEKFRRREQSDCIQEPEMKWRGL